MSINEAQLARYNEAITRKNEILSEQLFLRNRAIEAHGRMT